MWTEILSGVTSLVTSWFNAKAKKYEAEAELQMQLAKSEADWDLVAQRQAQYSWKDEIITIIWFSPLIYGWYDAERAMAWVAFVSELPYWYQFGMFGILSASFGLRWYFKQMNFKVGK